MTKVRDAQFDNIKAILIFLVVLGHVLNRFGDSDTSAIYKIIYSFHMPAFVFVSGYFAKFNPKKVFSELFPLYIIFQLLQILEQFVYQWIQNGHPTKVSFDLFTPQWTLWYLVAIMIFQLLIPIFDTDNRKKQLGFLILSLALGFMIGFAPSINNLLTISRVFVFLPYFILGYYERKNGILRSIGRDRFSKLFKFLAASVGIVLIIYFYLHRTYISKSWLNCTDTFNDGASMLWRVLLWGIGFLWIMILLIWVPKRPLGYINTVGKNTLAIYLLQAQAILILEHTPLSGWIGTNLLTIILAAFIITFGLSWNGFEKIIKMMKIPIKSE